MIRPPANRLLSQWEGRIRELEALARPLLDSPAVQRLRNITFLGVLSPRFRDVGDHPLWPADRPLGPPFDDGSRYEHTLGVALTALDLARKFGLSDRGQRYAVAWGLTHDIAELPLSHTAEPAFETATTVSSRGLRTAMLLSREPAPPRYQLAEVLAEIDVSPEVLAGMFGRSSELLDEELGLLAQVVGSPLTPDTLEGTWRCGVVFDLAVPSPAEVLGAIVRQDRTAALNRQHLTVVLDFWRRKAEVYSRFINRPDVVMWESSWSFTLQRIFARLTLDESLEIHEEKLVADARAEGLPNLPRVLRYKQPQQYFINGSLDALPPEPPVGELWRVLRREPIGSSSP